MRATIDKVSLYPCVCDSVGIGKLSTVDGNRLADPEVLRRLTSSVSCALDEAAAALTRMRTEQQSELPPVDRFVTYR